MLFGIWYIEEKFNEKTNVRIISHTLQTLIQIAILGLDLFIIYWMCIWNVRASLHSKMMIFRFESYIHILHVSFDSLQSSENWTMRIHTYITHKKHLWTSIYSIFKYISSVRFVCRLMITTPLIWMRMMMIYSFSISQFRFQVVYCSLETLSQIEWIYKHMLFL